MNNRLKNNKPSKNNRTTEVEAYPMLKTVEQMSRISGIGENKLRELMDNGELEYLQNGNRRLIADEAIWAWYDRSKIIPRTARPGNNTFHELMPEV